MKYRTRYHNHVAVKTAVGVESMTKQNHKDECDINKIISKFNRTGQLPAMIKAKPEYGDFADPVSYHEACNMVIKAKEQFDSLPSAVRGRFQNDPEKFLAFATNAANAEEMAKLGLMKPDAVKRVNAEKAPPPRHGWGGKKGVGEAEIPKRRGRMTQPDQLPLLM